LDTISFSPVADTASVERVAALAAETWREHYTPMIGAGQVDYMLRQFQSAAAITGQINAGYRYFLIKEANEAIGYFSAVPRDGELFLSKIYLLAAFRGKGFGRKAMTFLECLARVERLSHIRLTVNKNNHNSIAAYKKFGFEVHDSVVADIGGGYVMDDYIMAKRLTPWFPK
jgi:diamine N-acetyltransferase